MNLLALKIGAGLISLGAITGGISYTALKNSKSITFSSDSSAKINFVLNSKNEWKNRKIPKTHREFMFLAENYVAGNQSLANLMDKCEILAKAISDTEETNNYKEELVNTCTLAN